MPKLPRPALAVVAAFTLPSGLATVVLVGLANAIEPSTTERGEFFERHIRPVLAEHCYMCHSSASGHPKGGLLLDHPAAVAMGGDSGPALVPGKPDESLLIQAIRYEGPEMPPQGKLPDPIIETLVAWVASGAPLPADAPLHAGAKPQSPQGVGSGTGAEWEAWCFHPLSRSVPPQVANVAWPRTRLDSFILARLERAGLGPVEEADRRTLLRRAMFDLIGLPPTLEDVRAFESDSRPEAFARILDRLLSDPRYGERWARHWLDVARYAEDQAHSFQPRLYPEGFRYRDWVVRAMNDDLRYDAFIRKQIAADLVEGAEGQEDIAALGFFAIGPVYYGDKQMFDQIDDRIDTLTRGFLGLTVSCARCHDHKFDPISTEDYYALAGVIASSEYCEVPLAPPEVVAAYQAGQNAIAQAEKSLEAFLEEQAKQLDCPKKEVESRLQDEDRQRLALLRGELERAKTSAPPKFPFAHALREGDAIRDLPVNIRGNPKQTGSLVPRRFLTVLGGDFQRRFVHGSGRRELADAIASEENPLTARVYVNRLWQAHFGQGLVRTASNFGALGEPPSHPELLDCLARDFLESGWSTKRLHREILLSSTYALSSRRDEPLDRADPENRLLGRMNRRRLEVEPWRDAMLAVSGELNGSMGGPSGDLSQSDFTRRTLYGKVSRHELDSLLRLFDFPDPNITAAVRTRTTVPIQQLFVLNSEFIQRRAAALAARARQEGGSDTGMVERAFQLACARSPSDAESEAALEFVRSTEVCGPESPKDALDPWKMLAQVLLASSEFLYVD